MQDKPQLTSETSLSLNESSSVNQHSSHHVSHRNLRNPKGHAPAISKCPLMSIPDESLTHITSLVADPPSLFALSRVNRRLRDHIADDNTWYRAFAFHFLGVGPETEPEDGKRLMLRRSESTWVKEYVMRFNLTRRWERSRSATLNYQPHYWGVSSMHLLENVSLMTANLQYGVVTRSFPLTGKILKGYLDASGTTNGFGIGNPNEEFSPNVSCIALSSCGGTGRIAWGFRNGEVAMTSASRVMESNRSAARYIRCCVEDEHAGEVRSIAFAGRDDELLVTGCARGQVKLWDTKRTRCLWTGLGAKAGSVIFTACVKVSIDVGAGILVATLEGGNVMVWWGFKMQPDGLSVEVVQDLRIAEDTSSESRTVDTLLLDPSSSPSRASILVHYADSRDFIRLLIDLPSSTVHRTIFTDGPLGPITAINACFSAQSGSLSSSTHVPPTPVDASTSSLAIAMVADKLKPRECSFVLAGDSLGRVCVWNWDMEGSSAQSMNAGNVVELPYLSSSRKWEAHEDGAICAIEITDSVIVTGSTRGILKVWDSLTFAPLRSFSSPASKPSATGEWDRVGQITVRRDLLVASIGSRILVWQAGAVTLDKKRNRKSPMKPKGRATGSALNKWQQQIELNRDIRESQRLLDDERAHSQQVYGRERAQLSTLDQLGLDEREAVEYLLMLSREEEEQRRVAELAGVRSESGGNDTLVTPIAARDDLEGVFPLDDPTGLVPSHPSSEGSTPDVTRLAEPIPNIPPRSLPRFTPSTSNFKVQVSPPFLPEPTEAGLSASPLSLAATQPGNTSPVPMNGRRSSGISSTSSSSSSADLQHFPAMSSSSSTSSRSVPSSVRLAGSWTRGSPSNSFIGASRGGQPSSSMASASRSPSMSVQGGGGTGLNGSEEDDDLRFVLELSLAEARSRGEA